MNVRCKYWSQNQEYPNRGDCSKGIKELPDYQFCVGQCIHYHEPDLPIGQRTVEKEQSKIDDFLHAQKRLLLEGRVKEEVAQYRLTICTGLTVEGNRVSYPCDHYGGDIDDRGKGKCGACGCKTWKISEMKVKVYYPIACPINRFSSMPGRRIDNADNSSTRSQPEAEEGQGTRSSDPDFESGWPPSQRI